MIEQVSVTQVLSPYFNMKGMIPMINFIKLCECGCKMPAPISDRTSTKWGTIKGQPRRFINHHNVKPGQRHPAWNGGKKYDDASGILIWNPYHPRANISGYVLEHILIAERILGHPPPLLVVIHHPNGNQDNSVFVICENQAYHLFLHQRIRALGACGHANWRKCVFCKKYDDPQNLFISKLSRGPIFHRNCRSEYKKSRRQCNSSL